MFAAVPAAHQPCGANGRPVVGCARRQCNGDGDRDDADEHRRKRKLEARRHAQPDRVREEDCSVHGETDHDRDARTRTRQIGDVVAADQRDRRAAEEDGGHEPGARDGCGSVAERRTHVRGDTARDRVPYSERGERDRERRGEDEQGRPGEDRRRARSLHRERGNEQETGADERADVQRRASRDAEHPRDISGQIGRISPAIRA
jgi:hypothetical protein